MNTKPSRRFILIITMILLTPALLMSSETIYVRSAKAPLLEKPAIGSTILLNLPRGTPVTRILEDGIWYKVTYNDQTGWLCKLMTGSAPPSTVQIQPEAELEKISGSARKRPSAFTTTAAARGLMDKRKRFASKYKLDFSALEKIEAVKIADDDIDDFLRIGGLN